MTGRWPAEAIPDEDRVYLRVHKSYVDNSGLQPGVFKDREGAMSTDWEKYSTPDQSRGRARKPELNGLIALRVGPLRNDVHQEVVHSPDEERDNRSHTDVRGRKGPEERLKLLRLAVWAIPVDSGS